jgi:hypothetical protein
MVQTSSRPWYRDVSFPTVEDWGWIAYHNRMTTAIENHCPIGEVPVALTGHNEAETDYGCRIALAYRRLACSCLNDRHGREQHLEVYSYRKVVSLQMDLEREICDEKGAVQKL